MHVLRTAHSGRSGVALYALLYDERDTEEFHLILREFQPLGDGHPALEAWIRRVDERPRA